VKYFTLLKAKDALLEFLVCFYAHSDVTLRVRALVAALAKNPQKPMRWQKMFISIKTLIAYRWLTLDAIAMHRGILHSKN
jgi:hypothetical protein